MKADRCTRCHRIGHTAIAHEDPSEAALMWARTVLCDAKYAFDGGARLLIEETAAYWSDVAYGMMRP